MFVWLCFGVDATECWCVCFGVMECWCLHSGVARYWSLFRDAMKCWCLCVLVSWHVGVYVVVSLYGGVRMEVPWNVDVCMILSLAAGMIRASYIATSSQKTF